MPMDISALLKYAPTTAAGFMGIDQRQEEDMQDTKRQELLQLIQSRIQDADQKAQKFPLDLEALRLGNQKTGAEIPGVVADSSLKGYNAAKAAGTLDSDIAAKNDENRMKGYQTIGQHLGSISGAIDANPSAPPHAVFAQQLKDMQVPDAAAAALMQKYANVPPAQLSARLKADGSKLLRENPEYAKTIDQENVQQAGANSRNAATIASAQKIEQMRIDAGKYDKKGTQVNVETQLLKAKTAKEKAEILEQAYQVATAAGDEDAAKQYATRATQARQRAAEDAANMGLARPGIDVPGVAGLPPQQRPQAAAPIAGGTAAAPASAATNADLINGAKAAWGSYDPSKYVYRVGPNGQLQRKEK